MEKQLLKAIIQLDEKEVLKSIKKGLAQGLSNISLQELMQEGMEKVGILYERGDYFIGDLIMAGEIFKEVLRIKGMSCDEVTKKNKCTLVIGTVEGDVHDIGKDIFSCMLEASGFKVYDLGSDVSKEHFVEQVKLYQPSIVGLSGILTSSLDSMKSTIEALAAEGLREKVKIIIGGRAISQEIARQLEVDDFAASAREGVVICEQWQSEEINQS